MESLVDIYDRAKLELTNNESNESNKSEEPKEIYRLLTYLHLSSVYMGMKRYNDTMTLLKTLLKFDDVVSSVLDNKSLLNIYVMIFAFTPSTMERIIYSRRILEFIDGCYIQMKTKELLFSLKILIDCLVYFDENNLVTLADSSVDLAEKIIVRLKKLDRNALLYDEVNSMIVVINTIKIRDYMENINNGRTYMGTHRIICSILGLS